MVTLDELAIARARINEVSLRGPHSIWRFYDETAERFRLTISGDTEGPSTPRTNSNGSPAEGRLTTTATCLEAVLDYGARIDDDTRERVGPRLNSFTAGALHNDPANWTSEDAAWVYCRVRTLGSILRLQTIPEALVENAHARVNEAWQSHTTDEGAYGLREATPTEVIDPPSWLGVPTDLHYPENAYLTYWGVVARLSLPANTIEETGAPGADGSPEAVQENSGPHEGNQESKGSPPPARANAEVPAEARSWLIASAAAQITYHYSRSPLLDPQQLLWSLAGLAQTVPAKIALATSREHEIVRAGLRAFFESQDERGEWSRGAALFHYPKAGNAYCYIYETLGEFLSLALRRDSPAAETLRRLLEPYFQHLMNTFESLMRTRQRLGDGDDLIGWSSGHHPHRLAPESWATASVYRFLEMFRRLVGFWANNEAQRVLSARRPRKDRATLIQRGDTWDVGVGSVGLQFAAMFVHPVTQQAQQERTRDPFIADPDVPVLGEDQAHSAVLFGPPGTGKTTLVEAVAGMIGWEFIEITPAQFLSDGVDKVSARADAIFNAAMELDHCVVLLDEIDELIQTRKETADPIERFFTTTMLPRLTNLWNAGKVLFFVNTNGIQNVDPAIRRSQRFDTVVMVMPPGFHVKKRLLRDAGIDLTVDKKQVDDLLNGETSDTPSVVGWFGLLRYDQIGALAATLQGDGSATGDLVPVGAQELATALRPFGVSLASLDWERDKNTAIDDPEKLPNLKNYTTHQRRDPKVKRLVLLEGSEVPSGLRDKLGAGPYLAVPSEVKIEDWIASIGATASSDAIIVFDSPAS